MTTFRHVLMMRFKDDASEEQIGAFFDGMALVADSDSDDEWHSYTNLTHYQAFIAKDVAPIVAEGARAQYEVN